jgi:hypothetical protein
LSSELNRFVTFLEEQRAKQASFFPTVKYDKVLSFMGTTSLSGSTAAMSVHRVHGLTAGASDRELLVTLAGPLPRAPQRGESLSVHLTRVEHYQGFQVKTRPLSVQALESDLVERQGTDRVVVKGASIYTVHHSPYTLKFFENVPLDEVVQVVGAVRYALVNVGESANVSPRFVFHHEVKDGRPVLFHGDGLALKTYMNLRSNRVETRVVLDLETYRGFAARTTVEEFAPHQHPEAYDRICRGFTAGNWGKPSRVFRCVVEDVTPITPIG